MNIDTYSQFLNDVEYISSSCTEEQFRSIARHWILNNYTGTEDTEDIVDYLYKTLSS